MVALLSGGGGGSSGAHSLVPGYTLFGCEIFHYSFLSFLVRVTTPCVTLHKEVVITRTEHARTCKEDKQRPLYPRRPCGGGL